MKRQSDETIDDKCTEKEFKKLKTGSLIEGDKLTVGYTGVDFSNYPGNPASKEDTHYWVYRVIDPYGDKPIVSACSDIFAISTPINFENGKLPKKIKIGGSFSTRVLVSDYMNAIASLFHNAKVCSIKLTRT